MTATPGASRGLLAVATTLVLLAGQSLSRCPNTRPVSCTGNSQHFRTQDGSCNNERDPTQGMANTPLGRVLPAQYADGRHQPRQAVSGKPLPGARRIVTKLFTDVDTPSKSTNNLVMTWAQLVSHDVARIQAPFPRPNGRCCSASPANTTDSCARIDVPSSDPFYSRFGVRCIGVDRSAASPCNSEVFEQNSLVTHYLDASFVYGSSLSTTRKLREFRGGRLRSQIIRLEEFLPKSQDGNLEAGDARVTITPMLAALQTLFLREHNRVARHLGDLNPLWSDERCFQESRKIVIAEWQLLTYRDWLQWIIGTETVSDNGLMPSLDKYSDDYDASVAATTANDFTSASYRSFHSMVPNDVWFGGGAGERLERFMLTDLTADMILSPTNFRRIVIGMVYQARQKQDQHMAGEITNRLFKGSKPFGGDLISTDVERGREHGLSSYNDFREHCKLGRATKFSHFNNTISEKNIALLRAVYEHPDDVDYYVGGLLETIDNPSPLDSVTSPVFRCVVIDQFQRWRRGDRFFFDRPGPQGFTPDQLKALGEQSMARLICDNGSGPTRILDDAFLKPGVLGNREKRCSDIPGIDFRPWRETRKG